MELTDEQKQKVAAWIEEGLKLSDIQRRLTDELDVHLTYMEMRFLIDDLKLTLKETVVPPPPVPVEAPPEASAAPVPSPLDPSADALPAAGGRVAVVVDQMMRPGTLVSGSATFSDGKKAAWHLDQMGRLGMVPEEPGYRPPEPDVAEFQMALERELVKLGM